MTITASTETLTKHRPHGHGIYCNTFPRFIIRNILQTRYTTRFELLLTTKFPALRTLSVHYRMVGTISVADDQLLSLRVHLNQSKALTTKSRI